MPEVKKTNVGIVLLIAIGYIEFIGVYKYKYRSLLERLIYVRSKNPTTMSPSEASIWKMFHWKFRSKGVANREFWRAKTIGVSFVGVYMLLRGKIMSTSTVAGNVTCVADQYGRGPKGTKPDDTADGERPVFQVIRGIESFQLQGSAGNGMESTGKTWRTLIKQDARRGSAGAPPRIGASWHQLPARRTDQ